MVVVGNPSVMVLIKNAVIAVVIILSGVITSIVVGVAAFVILVSVVIGGLVCISVVVDTKVVMLINCSLPCTMVIVKVPPFDGGNDKKLPTLIFGKGLIITAASEKATANA